MNSYSERFPKRPRKGKKSDQLARAIYNCDALFREDRDGDEAFEDRQGAILAVVMTPCKTDGEALKKLRFLMELDAWFWNDTPGKAGDRFDHTVRALDIHLSKEAA